MADINAAFTRRLLQLMHADVRKAFPQIPNVMQAASVTGTPRCYFVEIDVPGIKRFTFESAADDARHARYKAWSAFLGKHAPAEWCATLVERQAARAEA